MLLLHLVFLVFFHLFSKTLHNQTYRNNKNFTLNLKTDLEGTKIRASCISPGLSKTEFAVVRFKGDIEKALSKAVAGGFNGTHQLSQVVRKTIGSWVGEEHRRKPMIIPLVVEV